MPYNFVITKQKAQARDLSEICVESGLHFQRILEGNNYCCLAMGNRKVECPYLSDVEDENLLRVCLYGLLN